MEPFTDESNPRSREQKNLFSAIDSINQILLSPSVQTLKPPLNVMCSELIYHFT